MGRHTPFCTICRTVGQYLSEENSKAQYVRTHCLYVFKGYHILFTIWIAPTDIFCLLSSDACLVHCAMPSQLSGTASGDQKLFSFTVLFALQLKSFESYDFFAIQKLIYNQGEQLLADEEILQHFISHFSRAIQNSEYKRKAEFGKRCLF